MKEIVKLRMANDTNGNFLYCRYILNNKLPGGIQRNTMYEIAANKSFTGKQKLFVYDINGRYSHSKIIASMDSNKFEAAHNMITELLKKKLSILDNISINEISLEFNGRTTKKKTKLKTVNCLQDSRKVSTFAVSKRN